MTVAEAARALEVAPRVVYDLCRAGLLGHQRIGVRRGVIRITEADLAAYVASRRVEPRGVVARETPAPAATLFNPLDRMRAERAVCCLQAEREPGLRMGAGHYERGSGPHPLGGEGPGLGIRSDIHEEELPRCQAERILLVDLRRVEHAARRRLSRSLPRFRDGRRCMGRMEASASFETDGEATEIGQESSYSPVEPGRAIRTASLRWSVLCLSWL
jgi:hypothetical protein